MSTAPTSALLKKGYYPTKGGHLARIDRDIEQIGIGVVRNVGYVAYKANGEFAYKDEAYGPVSAILTKRYVWQILEKSFGKLPEGATFSNSRGTMCAKKRKEQVLDKPTPS